MRSKVVGDACNQEACQNLQNVAMRHVSRRNIATMVPESVWILALLVNGVAHPFLGAKSPPAL